MRRVIVFLFGGIVLVSVTSILAQQPPVIPAVAIKQAPVVDTAGHDLTRLTPLQRAALGGTKSGLAWLMRVNKPDGRFVPGFEPS